MEHDRSAEACFRDCYPGLVRFLHGMLGEREPAEDTAQEAFRRLLARGPRRRPDADRWVFRVGRRIALDLLKTERRRRTREAAWAPPTRHEPFSEDDVVRVRAVVAELPERAREVLLLQAINGCSLSEIAEIVGRSVGAVKQDLYRARLALRRAWNAHQEIDP